MSLDRKRNAWVMNLTRKSARLFAKEGERVATALEKNKDWQKAIADNKAEWEKFLIASYKSITAEIGTETFENIAEQLRGEKAEKENAFDPYSEDINKYIVMLAGTKVTLVSDWTKQIIGALVLDAEKENWSMDKLAKEIRNEYKEFSRYRAYRIARTETQNALGFAQYSAGQQAQDFLGVDITGEWVTSLDERVRDSHKELHGKKAKLGEAFPNGLQYAGEYTTTKGGHNNINCRCVIIHHF